ncbi:MAG: OmpA family protein [Pseudomonadota bacterium]
MNLTTVIAASVIALSSGAVQAHQTGYWHDSDGVVVRDGNGDCVRTGLWSEADALPKCEGRSVSQKRRIPTPVTPERSAEMAEKKRQEARAKEQAETLAELSNVSLSANTAFAVGSADLSEAGKRELDELATQLKSLEGVIQSIEVVGHTDSSGSAALNQQISEDRASAVKAYLVEQGIDGDSIGTQGKGESEPVASNDTAAGRASNRRVEIAVDADVQ